MKKKTSAKMIKKAIDSYPGGICFSALDGRVILVNEKMNGLVLELTGHTILNAKVTWEELKNFTGKDKVKKLDQSWLPKDPDNGNENIQRQMFFVSLTIPSGVFNGSFLIQMPFRLRLQKLRNFIGSAKSCMRIQSAFVRCRSGKKLCWTVLWK